MLRWIAELFRPPVPSDAGATASPPARPGPASMVGAPDVPEARYIAWLLDAPLFIDDALVDRLFDSVVRPTYEIESRKVGQVSEVARKTVLEAAGKAGWESALPFLGGPKAEVSGGLKRESGSTDRASEDLTLRPVQNAGRKLEELAAVYMSNMPSRLVFVDAASGRAVTLGGDEMGLDGLERAGRAAPRTLVFVDLPPGSIVIPTFCEFEGGGFASLYQPLVKSLWADAGEEPPSYPKDDDPAAPAKRVEYWDGISARFSSRRAIEVVEEAAGAGRRLGWIDFRLHLGRGRTMHLHAVPAGRAHAGVFGYNFVRRAHRHGARLVGALKSGLDLNVAAIFES